MALWGCTMGNEARRAASGVQKIHLIEGYRGVLSWGRRAQSGFNRKQWTQSQSFGNYLVEKRGSDLVSVVHVGVGRMQST